MFLGTGAEWYRIYSETSLLDFSRLFLFHSISYYRISPLPPSLFPAFPAAPLQATAASSLLEPLSPWLCTHLVLGAYLLCTGYPKILHHVLRLIVLMFNIQCRDQCHFERYVVYIPYVSIQSLITE